MIDASVWDIVKTLLQFLVFPIVGVVSYFVKQNLTRIDSMETSLREAETRLSVVESKIDDIREDLKEIKHGINRLIDRRIDDRK